MTDRYSQKRKVAVSGAWQPLSLTFLRSIACAELSGHAAKLLLDLLAMLGPNATRNGDLSLAPKVMALRGWTSRATLDAAVKELVAAELLFMTRQGGRKDCSLWAVTLYPLDCDPKKIEVRPGCFTHRDYMGENQVRGKPPTAQHPAVWKKARKNQLGMPRSGTMSQKSVPARNELPPTSAAG